MRVLVTGDRNYTDVETIGGALERVQVMWNEPGEHIGNYPTIIHGGATGADTIAQVLAEWMGFPTEGYAADWKRYGRAAGPIRNQQMLDTGVDLCLAFHNDLENSKGTLDMVTRCQEAGVPVRLYSKGEVLEFN